MATRDYSEDELRKMLASAKRRKSKSRNMGLIIVVAGLVFIEVNRATHDIAIATVFTMIVLLVMMVLS